MGLSPRPVAVVTGAGRGIGATIARHLVAENWRVVLTARSAHELDEVRRSLDDASDTVRAHPCDIRDPEAVGALVERTTTAWGRVDALINNAAYAGTKRPFLETSTQQWRTALNTNVLGTVVCIRAVLPGMLAAGAGRIVNLNSLQGSDTAGSPMAYGVSKAAVMRLTDGLGQELADTPVRVFDLSPGLVRTRMTSGRPDLDALPESAWSSADLAGAQAMRLLSGEFDALHGRFVRATDDLDALLKRVRDVPDARILRLTSKDVAMTEGSQ